MVEIKGEPVCIVLIHFNQEKMQGRKCREENAKYSREAKTKPCQAYQAVAMPIKIKRSADELEKSGENLKKN